MASLMDEIVDCSQMLLENGTLHVSEVLNSTMLRLCNVSSVDWVYMMPLWETDFPMALLYCCLVGVALCVGTFGNLVIVAISCTTRTMNQIGRYFVINLALADLCVTALADPMCILGVLKGEVWFQDRGLLCDVVASVCLTACFCAFFNLALLTFNRYVFVCKHAFYHKIFKKPVCILMCACSWTLAFLMEFPNLSGWGGHFFDSKNHQCIWDRTASFSYTLFVTAGLIGGNLFMMSIGFIAIFCKIYTSKRNVFSLNLDDPLRMRRVWREAWHSSRTLVAIFLVFLICWTPYAVITAIDTNDTYSTEVHLFATMVAHLHSSLNFTIYMCFNGNFRHSVYRLLCYSVTSWKYPGSMETNKTNTRGAAEKASNSDSGVKGDVGFWPDFRKDPGDRREPEDVDSTTEVSKRF